MTVLDALIAQGYTRHVARRNIIYGRVKVDGHPVVDPKTPVPDGSKVTTHALP